MKIDALENIVTAGNINGGRNGERLSEMSLDGLRRWHERTSSTELIDNSRAEICGEQ